MTCFYLKHFYKKIIPKINIALPFYPNKVFLSLTKDNVSARQHKLQYKDGVAMQDNVAQHWWNSAILVGNTISNTGKFVKIVYSNFLVKMVVGTFITENQEIDDCR